uniref:Uncharacterized protein n=1 Tax=Ditylenchus dipsaci TaxID=166011 RepID=A0A915DH75_9BILA
MMQSSMHHQQQPHHHPNIGGTFGVGAGGMPVVAGGGPIMHHHPPGMHTENDSVWQDPDGSLKKWQRDTGTALWGDPTKHNEQSIQRWQQFTAVIDSPNSARGGSKPLLGWGDPLPPDEKASKSGNQTGTDAWKASNEPKEFGMPQRRNTGFEGLHQQQNEWEAPSTSSNMFPISSSLGAAPTIKHQSAPKVSLAEELSAMGLDDIAGNGQSRKPEVGTSLW